MTASCDFGFSPIKIKYGSEKNASFVFKPEDQYVNFKLNF